MSRQILGITMGDPSGVGPEVIVKAWPRLHSLGEAAADPCHFVVYGSTAVMERAATAFAPDIHVREVSALDEVSDEPNELCVLNVCDATAAEAPPAKIDARGGQAAYDALVAAAQDAKAGLLSALVTAPLHKAALWQAGHEYPGHTELLAELCGTPATETSPAVPVDVAMMLYLPPGEGIVSPGGLGVGHVTLHMALRDVFTNLTPEKIATRAQLVHQMMERLMPAEDSSSNNSLNSKPRIAVCALNPHAGEEGLFGDEETSIVKPGVELARAAGINAVGPIATDTLMVRAAAGEFDGVVALYHDQGHIALKLLGMHRAVNVTLGLPIVRTSVAHGTAFDRAWQGTSDENSMVVATEVAVKLATRQTVDNACS